MSKNFEEEYKNMVASEVPDLWGRIEAGLREKEVKAVPEEAVKQEPEVTATATPEPVQAAAEPAKSAPAKKKNVIFKILPWVGGIAAAALILIVAVPTVILVSRSKSTKSATMENAAYTIDMEPAAQRETMQDSVNNLTGSVSGMGEAVMEESFAEQDNVATEAPDADGVNSYKQYADSKKDLKTEIAGSLPGSKEEREVSEAGEEDLTVIARICRIYEKDGRKCCIIETVLDVEDFYADGLEIETSDFVLSEDSEVEPEVGEIYKAAIVDNELLLISKYE